MLCSVCGDPLYPGEGVYSFEDPNDFLEKEDPLTIEKIKYQVTDIGAGLIFSALMLYEKSDRYYTNTQRML